MRWYIRKRHPFRRRLVDRKPLSTNPLPKTLRSSSLSIKKSSSPTCVSPSVSHPLLCQHWRPDQLHSWSGCPRVANSCCLDSSSSSIKSVRIKSKVSLLSSTLSTTPHFQVTCNGFTTDHPASLAFGGNLPLPFLCKTHSNSKSTPSLVHLCLQFPPTCNNCSHSPPW